MRSLVRHLIVRRLRRLSGEILASYAPMIVAVTGSAGKTGTVSAIQTALRGRFRVRASLKNYNTELGVPLSILGEASPRRSIAGWFRVFAAGQRLLVAKDPAYPEMLVLEFGADRPGDIALLTELAPPNVGVVTAVGPTHLERFESIDAIAREKSFVISRLQNDGLAILNVDDPRVAAMAGLTKARVIRYGFSERADVRASDVRLRHEAVVRTVADVHGVVAKIHASGNVVPLELPHVVGQHQLGYALAAIAVAAGRGMNLHESTQALRDFVPSPGRLRLLPGVKRTLLLDDSYNSSPNAALAALKVAAQIPNPGRTIAVLGDMAELGSYTQTGHEEVGRAVPTAGIHTLVTVGEKARTIGRAASAAGLSEEQVFHFGRSEEAGRFLQDRIREGDLVLVKGSQVARTEKIVKELMAEPERAPELLVRQGKEWE